MTGSPCSGDLTLRQRAERMATGIEVSKHIDLPATIDAKMAVNRARRWKLTGDGHGQHVEEA